MPVDDYEAIGNIDYIVQKVSERGWSQIDETEDDFQKLRREPRFREAQVAALYEQYFEPERHEFEWQVLDEIARYIIGIGVGGAVLHGVIGNAAYDAIKAMCFKAASAFRRSLGPNGQERAKGFDRIGEDAETLKSFFQSNEKARIGEIESSTGIGRESLYPLLKLAGFRHARTGTDQCNWSRPTPRPA